MTLASTDTPADTRPHGARPWIGAALAIAIFAPLSFFFLDRPVAQLSYDNLRPWRKIFDGLTHIVDPLVSLVLIVFVWALVMVARRRPLGPVCEALVRTAAGLCVAVAIKDQLKYAFGRTWPETWTNNNPSFFGNGTYGFFPFHGGQGWYSFPSGHTTAICAVAAALWILWPRGRPLYALVVGLVVIGLLGADYHWLSDIVAGGALGAATGVVAARIGRPSRS